MQEDVFDKVLPVLVNVAQSLRLGNAFDVQADAGPLISEAHLNVWSFAFQQFTSKLLNILQRVMGYIASGKDDGATLLTGGERIDRAGYFVQPTLFTDVKQDSKIAREEIFGPVGVIMKFRTEAEVIKLANDSEYGLSSNIYTQNIDRAIRVAHSLEAGNAFVNMFSVLSPQVTFGGVKQSGFGKHLGQQALDEYVGCFGLL